MRLIDADELYSTVDKDMYDVSQHSAKGRAIHLGEYSHFLKRIVEAPTIEAEPIIRCKDCRGCIHESKTKKYCHIHKHHVCEDDFCSIGKKMDGDE